MELNEKYYKLLRAALTGDDFDLTLSEKEWDDVLEEAFRQSVAGVMGTAVSRLPQDQQPPLEIAVQWAGEVETEKGLNQLLNTEAARLTQFFGDLGRRTAILKGQANARLYPDPLSREPGDIDIWVEGGRESVIRLLDEQGMMPEGEMATSYHHVHLPADKNGLTVEVHFRPSSGNNNPITNRRLQRWLEQEILKSEKVEEGFCVPTIPFALEMQLAHIQRHFFSSGVGLRHLCDYYVLLQHSTEEERKEVSESLRRFGLWHIVGAVMWVLSEVLHLDEERMLCKPDGYRGEWLLREVMSGGNFGYYSGVYQKGVFGWFFTRWCRRLRLMRFDFWEALFAEMDYWVNIVKRIPLRIKYGKLSLRDVDN